MSPKSIRIIGAGLSGLALGQCLRRVNIRTVIYERVKANPTRNNYGITLYKSTYKPLLDTLRMTEDDFCRQVGVHNPDSGALVSDDQRLRVNRAALTSLLESNLDIRFGHKLNNITSYGTSRCVTFQNGTQDLTEDFSILIGADGVHSATRSQLNLSKPVFDLEVLPYIVFNGKRRMVYSNLPPGLLDCFTTPNGIQHVQNGVLLSIKADFWNPDKQTVAVSYTLSRAADKADQALLDRNISDAETLAKSFVDEVATLGQLPAPFDSIFNTDTMSEDRLLHWLMRSSLIDGKVVQDTALNHGVILLGDAAHAQPIPGNGANLAIADALEAAKHMDASGKFDAAAFLEARSDWMNGKRENERALKALHPDGARKARI
ncbi:FAD/NAD(P)-binding domain-containing protein [Paraphaeosphaeria sporulosa]|uniref:FAD/NAD(P)-binding domain-containing protein n=1 Tax=Paraphaeosphaeria sporulosa TaxID=1460663 RepID=A0A177C944_9PLEO|nr:FAD/NAD(P)-binding domain-containing protein [Paraphaeosphaeria sporulosa]OAG04085.1 FAD/NAD(P)-binding domain-containing protein [Paraphaeosphaeria sporulosa]